MRTNLLMHKDKPPEFVEVRDSVRVVVEPSMNKDNQVTYEGLGKLFAYVSEPDEEPEVRASVWLFVHPDLVEQIKERGAKVTTDPFVWWEES